MAFEGYIDSASATEISGWIFNNSAPNQALEVEVMDGDEVIAIVTADGMRSDLVATGKGNGAHAFAYSTDMPARGPLSARVVGKRWRIAPSGGHNIRVTLPMRLEAWLAHSLEYGLPAAVSQQGFSTPIAVGEDTEIARRLMRSYDKTVADNPEALPRKNDQWSSLEAIFHQEILSLLKRDDARGLMLYLGNAHAKALTHGITQGEDTTKGLRKNPEARRQVMLLLLDYLASLAEFLGVVDVECPEQHGQWGENIHCDPTILVGRISALIGMQVVPPQVMGSLFGLRTGHGILGPRDLLSLYAALRTKSLISNPTGGASHGSVCEIGGGLGGVAYYANRLGVARYTIIDLPLVSLLQGYYLIRALPEVKIALYGEDMPDAAIRLLPTYAFAGELGSFDLLLNQDSMPEMHRDYAIGYLRQSVAKKIPLLLSINQESRAPQNPAHGQTAVRELAAEVGGYVCRHRFRHWLRAGYVEELYLLNK